MSFKLEQNVPDVYVEESRDFQLICRVLNIYLVQQLERVAQINNISDIDKCDSDLLPLLANKQGFTTSMYIPSNVLRNICKVFPYCIKRKGTKEAIRVAVTAVLAADQDVTLLEVNTDDWTRSHTIDIVTNAWERNADYIKEVLRFLLPAGFSYTLTTSVSRDRTIDAMLSFSSSGTVRLDKLNNTWMSTISSNPNTSSTNTNTPAMRTYKSRINFIKIQPRPSADSEGTVTSNHI